MASVSPASVPEVQAHPRKRPSKSRVLVTSKYGRRSLRWWVSQQDAATMVATGLYAWLFKGREIVELISRRAVRGPSCSVSGQARPGELSYLELLALQHSKELDAIQCLQILPLLKAGASMSFE